MELEAMGKLLSTMRGALPKWAPKEIDKDLCAIWTGVLKDYSDEEIKGALGNAISTLNEWPTPSMIKRLCQGTSRTDEEIGQEVSSRIEGAISKFGYTSPDKAKEYVGEIGWVVVQQCGGWESICEVDYDQLPSSRKQWRDIGTIVSKNFFTKGENTPQRLPERKDAPLRQAIDIISGSFGSFEKSKTL